MQTIIFNTKEKTAIVYEENMDSSKVLFAYNDVPTVGIRDGYYEVMHREKDEIGVVPVLRLPISNTNMVIKNI